MKAQSRCVYVVLPAVALLAACGNVNIDTAPAGGELPTEELVESTLPPSQATLDESSLGEVPFCSNSADTEAPPAEAVKDAHRAGFTDYGARDPAEVLTRMAEGRDAVTNEVGETPALGSEQGVFFEEFAASVAAEYGELRRGGDSAQGADSDHLTFEAPEGNGHLSVQRVEGHWFPTSWSMPHPCSPLYFPPEEPRLRHLLTLAIDPPQVSHQQSISIAAPGVDLSHGLELYIWTENGWDHVESLPEPELVIPDTWELGDYLVCSEVAVTFDCGLFTIVSS